jgi:pimeloyl-ACP methyl ester carboxylesterase
MDLRQATAYRFGASILFPALGRVNPAYGGGVTLYVWRAVASALSDAYDVLDRSALTIYATDISGLPTLLAALDEHDIARRVIVGDFAPFNRPELMHPQLRDLKEKPLSEQIRDSWNAGWEDLVDGRGFSAGLPEHAQFDIAREFKDDMAQHWSHNGMTTMEAFYHYYSFFTRDENDFEQRMGGLKTHVKVVWGELDPYINKAMGEELAARLGVEFKLLAGIGHYPHNQDPELVAAEIRQSFL